jgi:toxin ParE1/3/4
VRQPRYRLTALADADIEGILRYTTQRFGPRQCKRYAELIEKGATTAAEVPESPLSRARDELGPDVRSLHLERVAGRRGAASHVLFYRTDLLATGVSGITILRVLHDAMEPMQHLTEPFD